MSEHAKKLRNQASPDCCEKCEMIFAAASELDRLEAINARLVKACEAVVYSDDIYAYEACKAALAAAKELTH